MDGNNLNWRNQLPQTQREYIQKNFRGNLEKLPGMNVAQLDNIIFQAEKNIFDAAPSQEEYYRRCLQKIEEIKNSFGTNPQQYANNVNMYGLNQVPMMNQNVAFNNQQQQQQQMHPQMGNLNPALAQQMASGQFHPNASINMLNQLQRMNLLKQQGMVNPSLQALQHFKQQQQIQQLQQQQQMQKMQQAGQVQQQMQQQQQQQQMQQKLPDQVPTIPSMPVQNLPANPAQPQQPVARPVANQVTNPAQIPSTLNINGVPKAIPVPTNTQNPATMLNYPNQFPTNNVAGTMPYGGVNLQALATNPQLRQNLTPAQLAQIAQLSAMGKTITPAQYQILLQAQAAQNQAHAQAQALSMGQNPNQTQISSGLPQQLQSGVFQQNQNQHQHQNQNQNQTIPQPNVASPVTSQVQPNPNAFTSPAVVPQALANQQVKPATLTPSAASAEQPPIQPSPTQSPHVTAASTTNQPEKSDLEIQKIVQELSIQAKNGAKIPPPTPNLSAQDQQLIRQELEKGAKLYEQIDRLIFFTCKFTNEAATSRLIKLKVLIQSQLAVAKEGKFGLNASMISKLNQDLMRQHTRIENSIKGPNSAKLGPVLMGPSTSTNSQSTPATTPTLVTNNLSSEIAPLPLPPTNVTPNMPQKTLSNVISPAPPIGSVPQNTVVTSNMNMNPQLNAAPNPVINPLQNSLLMNMGNQMRPPVPNPMALASQAVASSVISNVTLVQDPANAIPKVTNLPQPPVNPVRVPPVRATRTGRPPRKQSQPMPPQQVPRPIPANLQQQFPHLTIPSQQMMMAGNRPIPVNQTVNPYMYNQGLVRPVGMYPQVPVGMPIPNIPVSVPAPTDHKVADQVKQEPQEQPAVKTEAPPADSTLKTQPAEGIPTSQPENPFTVPKDSSSVDIQLTGTDSSPLPAAFKSAVDHMKLNITNLQIPPSVKRKALHQVQYQSSTHSTNSPVSAHPSMKSEAAISIKESEPSPSDLDAGEPPAKMVKLELPLRDQSNPIEYATKALELLKHRQAFAKRDPADPLTLLPKSSTNFQEVFNLILSTKN